jgi:hypothetical protein
MLYRPDPPMIARASFSDMREILWMGYFWWTINIGNTTFNINIFQLSRLLAKALF